MAKHPAIQLLELMYSPVVGEKTTAATQQNPASMQLGSSFVQSGSGLRLFSSHVHISSIYMYIHTILKGPTTRVPDYLEFLHNV